jgi:3-hydroxyisobutyryl-CoA hydrolase
MSTQAPLPAEEPVLFESQSALRVFSLNRPAKHNALNDTMLELLLPKIMEWEKSDLCGTIVGRGLGKSFCAGGDVVGVVENAAIPEQNHKAIQFFEREFALDHLLANINKPYVVIMHGNTMGGGVGLSMPAPFRIATEDSVFAMPETKIGYYPDVGASFYLSRLDGGLGTYLGLTGDTVRGRTIFELGLATHYIPAGRVSVLLERLAALDKPSHEVINSVIEELSSEYQTGETSQLSGNIRIAIDHAFKHNRVEDILQALETQRTHGSPMIRDWAARTIETLNLRSPTSLRVSLEAMRRGKSLTLQEALNMELRLSTAYCMQASPDFSIGVKAVLQERLKGRPAWTPSTLEEVSEDQVIRDFFADSPYTAKAPRLSSKENLPQASRNSMRFALPTEDEIHAVVSGSHATGGNTGLTLPELITKFEDLRGVKVGLKEKISEVVSRQCEVVDNGDGNFVWLKWQPKKWENLRG